MDPSYPPCPLCGSAKARFVASKDGMCADVWACNQNTLKGHRPSNIYEDGVFTYRCGACNKPAVRYTNPQRAAWRHA